MPFAGLEISILIFAFYLNFKWSSKREKIFISQDKVTIEKGIHKADYRWEEFRTFTSFNVTKDINKVLKLSFRSIVTLSWEMNIFSLLLLHLKFK